MAAKMARYRQELADLPPDLSLNELIEHFDKVHRLHRRWKRLEEGRAEDRQEDDATRAALAAQDAQRAGLCDWSSLNG